MARPKTISDRTLLDTLLGQVAAVGPANLTFAMAAKAVGLSPATLVQRFGDKERLLEAVLLHAWDQLDAETAAADREEPVTREGAIGLLLRLAPGVDAETSEADGLQLLREDIRNPVLRQRGAAWGAALASALGRRLAEDGGDAQALGWQMANAWLGARLWWAFTRHAPFEIAIRQVLEAWCDTALAVRRP